MTVGAALVDKTTINLVVGNTSGITDGAYVDYGDITAAQMGNRQDIRVEFRGTMNGTGTAKSNPTINLFAQLKSIEGAALAPEPDDNYQHHHIGSIPLDSQNITTEQLCTSEDCPVPAGQDFHLWGKLDSGKDIGTSAYDVDVEPVTSYPSAS
jgi:hypothetical protein